MTHAVVTAPRKVEKTVRASLPVPLTDAEVQEKTTQMVGDMTELEVLETAFAQLKKEKSAEIKEIKAGIAKARRIITQRTENKTVEDAVQIYDLDAKRTWIEYRGQQFKNEAISEFEMKAMIKPPLFPEHDDADGDPATDDDEPGEDGLELAPLPGNVSDIEDVRRSETKKGGRKDHTASK